MVDVSVVIPVYMVETTLRRCVDSVLAQTYGDYNIILVDDGSPDGSGAICDEYAARDKRIHVIHKENGGLSDARNAGLRSAVCNYVMFLDSDDYLEKDCLETLRQYDSDMIIGSLYIQDRSGNFRAQDPVEDNHIPRASFSQKLPALFRLNRLNFVHGKLYSMRVIEKNGLLFEDDMLTSAEDTVFNFLFLSCCDSVYVCSRPVHRFVFSPGGLGHRFWSDRYERAKRLYHFLSDISRKMEIDTDEMKMIVKSRFLEYTNTIISTLPLKKITEDEMLRILKAIYDDEELRQVYASVSSDKFADLDALFEKSAKGYLSFWHRRNRMRKLKRITGVVKMYMKEILLRLHILKRQS